MRLRDSATAFCPSAVLEAARQAVGEDPGPYANIDALRVLCAAFDADRGNMHPLAACNGHAASSWSRSSRRASCVVTFAASRRSSRSGSRARSSSSRRRAPARRSCTGFSPRIPSGDGHAPGRSGSHPRLTRHGRSPAEYLESDRRIKRVARSLVHLYHWSPDLARLHHTTATQPEECFGLLEPALVSHSFMFYGPVEEYLSWLDGRSQADWLRAYGHYADQVRLLHWFAPGERWLLKSPINTWNIEALLGVFPDALSSQIHRTPSEFLGVCSAT